MSELQWKKRDFLTGAIGFDSHDYVSNSDLWIKDVSFSVQKNGWELYDNVELLDEFDTLKSAKAYAKMRYLFGTFYATLFGVKWLWEKLAGEMVAITITTALIYAYHYGC